MAPIPGRLATSTDPPIAAASSFTTLVTSDVPVCPVLRPTLVGKVRTEQIDARASHGRIGRYDVLIALLIVLGVNLIVIVMVAASVLGRKRYLKRQPGEFAGAIRVSNGDLNGLNSKWKHGSGRWVHDLLIWNKAPLLFRTELVPVDRLWGEHPEHAGDVKRLGKTLVIIEFASGDAKVEVAAKAEHRALVTGPFTSEAPAAREG